jgi:hypothetical protein
MRMLRKQIDLLYVLLLIDCLLVCVCVRACVCVVCLHLLVCVCVPVNVSLEFNDTSGCEVWGISHDVWTSFVLSYYHIVVALDDKYHLRQLKTFTCVLNSVQQLVPQRVFAWIRWEHL